MKKDVRSTASQLIVFDMHGTILSSCDTLFKASEERGKNIFETFPVLKCIEKDIEKIYKNDIPLFLPHIAFSRKKYHSICDFVFMKDGFGLEDVVVWMITDNAKHYRCLLNEKQPKNKNFYEQYSMVNKGNNDSFFL